MNDQTERNTGLFYKIGAFSLFIVIAGIIADIIIGNAVTSGDLSTLPKTAAGRFAEFNRNCWLGVYNLDLLNMVTQLILIPAFVALYMAHRKSMQAFAFLALVIFLVGTTLFVANNTALPMYDLSRKWAVADAGGKNMLEAAGEAMLARGAHGSPGVFLAFFIPTLGNLIMTWVMLYGKVFSKTTAWPGIIGNILMLAYVAMVNFIPGFDKMAIAFAMPGGLLILVWMILVAVRLYKLSQTV